MLVHIRANRVPRDETVHAVHDPEPALDLEAEALAAGGGDLRVMVFVSADAALEKGIGGGGLGHDVGGTVASVDEHLVASEDACHPVGAPFGIHKVAAQAHQSAAFAEDRSVLE